MHSEFIVTWPLAAVIITLVLAVAAVKITRMITRAIRDSYEEDTQERGD